MRYRLLTIPAVLGLCAMHVPAQEIVKDVQVEVRHGGTGAAGRAGLFEVAPQNSTFQFIAAEPALFGKVVTGAPYSGEGFTESVQTLVDGTRIVNKHSKKVWRDGKGRTREEGSLPMLGPWAAQAGGAPRFITIIDPVAKVIYMLNEKDKTATRSKIPDMSAFAKVATTEAKGGVNVSSKTEERREVVIRDGLTAPNSDFLVRADAGGGPVGGAVMMTRAIRIGGDGGKEEPLGTQTMEGLKVEGKRQTHTIPAGEVGNDRALTSVTDRWNSPELQVLVRMTAKDPQMGETTYRLTNIARAEPAANLFQVPADYTVKDATEHMRFEHKIETK